MSLDDYRLRTGPIFRTYQECHEQVLRNEHWFGDGDPCLGNQFTAERAKERKAEIVDLLFRSARSQHYAGEAGIADRLGLLGDKLFYCRSGHRCGSLACPECGRAFQRAKTAAQEIAIRQLMPLPHQQLVMATLIPLSVKYRPEALSALDVRKLNRWLKDALTRAAFDRIMLGSMDFSWEAERGIYQPHWHISMFTSNRSELLKRLKQIFPGPGSYDRPVVISKAYDLGYVAYKHKVVELPALLRRNRRGLPYLLLALDRTEPLELMVLFRARVSAQNGGLEFRRTPRRRTDVC